MDSSTQRRRRPAIRRLANVMTNLENNTVMTKRVDGPRVFRKEAI
jgi:hypothetical protein